MNADRAKLLFLFVVAALAGVFAFGIAQLPTNWRDAAILWVVFGLPALFFLLRVYHGYTAITIERIAKAPPQPQLPAPLGGVGGRPRPELRVVEHSTDGKQGRRLL